MKDKNFVITALQQKLTTRHLISDENDQTKEVNGVDSNLVFIYICKNSTFTIGKCTKLILERCENVHVNISATITTGCLEIIQCRGIIITSHSPIPTIQIDNTDGARLEFDEHGQMFNIVHCQSQNINVVVATNSELLPTMKDIKPGQHILNNSQVITRVAQDKYVSELLIREGNSGFTPESEYIHNLEKNSINKETTEAYEIKSD